MNRCAQVILLLAVALCGATDAAGQTDGGVVTPDVPAECPPEVKTLLPGVTLTLFAEHPQIVTPTGIDVDAQGRVWAVASHTHFRPDAYEGPEHDEVLVFRDTDGDGRADERRVFYDRTTATMDLELSPDGWVYLAQRDRILRVKDTNGDGRGDVAEDIAVLETSADYPHNGHSGLAWHPSGDLIFALGENYATPWTLTGADGATVHGSGEGGMFRCRPDGSGLRRIARGFWNPFGVCVREDGAMFAAENDPGSRPPCRLLYIVEGGDYGYQRLYGNAPVHPFVCWNGELRGTLPMVHATGEAPCGIAPLGGGLLVPSWAYHRIDFFPLHREGAGYRAQRIEVLRGSDFFRPTCMVQVADGDYFLTDWVFGSYELHQRGRIWRLRIDTGDAEWIDPKRPQPPNDASRLAAELRNRKRRFDTGELFKLASGDDPYLETAALVALTRVAEEWSPADVSGLPTPDRVSAALALRRARPRDEQWVRVFLRDEQPDVRFEALRWIADEQLASFQPNVERLLRQPQLSYRLFEAALATWNALNGHPSAGVSDPPMLLARVNNPQTPALLRAYALRLIDPGHKRLSLQLLRDLLDLEEPLLQFEVVRSLAGKATPESQALLAEVAADEQRPSRLRAEALVGLPGTLAEQQSLLLTLAQHADRAIREETLRSLRFVAVTEQQQQTLHRVSAEFPESADLVRAVLDPKSLEEDRPPVTDAAAWSTRLSAAGDAPDVEAGRRVFFNTRLANCATCHRHTGRGGVVGPDVSRVGQGSGESALLRSLLQPSRDVAPQFYPWKLLLEDGTVFTGIMLRKGGRSGREFYRDANGDEQSFLKSNIAARQELKTSLMPDGLQKTLTDREIRDLLAFLGESVP